MQSRTIQIAAHGGPKEMKLETVEVGAPGEGQAQVRHTAIGLNFIDCYQRAGLYPFELPHGIGLEAAGVVEAVGGGVTTVAPGDRVAYAGGRPGSYAERRNFPAARLVKIPGAITDDQAAAMMLKGMTAEYLLNRTYDVQAGETVLFHAAAGGVGLIAGQWGKAKGARMIGIAGGPEKCELAKAHGYDVVLDRFADDIAARVKELTDGKGVPVVYDSVGQATYEQTLDCLAPRGFFVSFGNASGPCPPVNPADLVSRGSLYFTRPGLVAYTSAPEDLASSSAALFDKVLSGAIKIEINQRYKLEDAVQAHTDLEGAKTTGSSLLTP